MKDLEIRVSKISDKNHMIKWLSDPKVLKWFPMSTPPEIEDAVNICLNYIPYQAIVTAEYKNEICGMACLYLQGFKKFSHHCLFVIIVDEKFRGKGVGTKLLQDLMQRAKQRFKIELLHLEVYDHNPAFSFYEKLGFVKYGYQKNFIKNADGTYLGKILMQKSL